MAQMNLFGQEATTLVQGIKKEKKERVSKKEPTRQDIKWEMEKAIKKLQEEYPINPKCLNTTPITLDIMREDLRDIIFKEDENGNRYRERIMDLIKQYGLKNWFIAKGYPTEEESIWKNRYTGWETTLGNEIRKQGLNNTFGEPDFEGRAYYLWENYLPKDKWTGELSNERDSLIKQIAELKNKLFDMRSKHNPMLNGWKEFLINLCKEKGQEIEHIWFDDSSPYECDISIRMKGHSCWSSCVSFRFNGDILHAYDSDFGHGTSFVNHLHQTHIDRIRIITEVMERVFNKECHISHTSFWNPDEKRENRKILLDEQGWLAVQGSVLA